MARRKEKATAARSKARSGNSSQGLTKQAAKQTSENEWERAPLHIQQKCLNVFRDALQPAADSDREVLQAVKGHLYNRDFATAFGRPEYLRVYASRWSPSRALGYFDLLLHLQPYILEPLDKDSHSKTRELSVACIGGGPGAEAVALAGWLHTCGENEQSMRLAVRCLDVAAWTATIAGLSHTATSQPELSQYASAAAKANNSALVSEEMFQVDFQQLDILSAQAEEGRTLFGDVDLVTLMFTLNELYTLSVPRTQQMLAMLTACTRPGAHLLVVDSPGSYSTVSINGTEKKYPMQWLLDYTLIGSQTIGKSTEDKEAIWEKVVVDESRWFRLPAGLEYPIELENMRYQMHLYRRLPSSAQVP